MLRAAQPNSGFGWDLKSSLRFHRVVEEALFRRLVSSTLVGPEWASSLLSPTRKR
jgi:hypothetical protein